MRLTKIACSHCNAVLKSRAGVRVGKKVVCPNCCEPFAAMAPEPVRKTRVLEGHRKERFASRRSTNRSTQRIARPNDYYRINDEPEDNAQWQDDLEAPQRRKRGRKPRRTAALNMALHGLLLLGVAILILAAVGTVSYVVLRKFQAVDTPVASQQSSSSDTRVSSTLDVPAGWKEFTSAKGRFRAVMPRPALERTRTMDSIVGPVKDTQYLRETDGKNLGYSISFGDFSRPQVSKTSLEQIIDAGRDAILRLYSGQLEADRSIERDGRPGREIIISAPGKGRFLIHYYISGSRLYTLTVAGSTATRDSKEVRAFFDSFHFTDAKP